MSVRTGYYVEKRYCDKCTFEHWLEVITTRHGTREVCRGSELEEKIFGQSEKLFLRHKGRGFEVVLTKLTKKGLPVLVDESFLRDDVHVSVLQVDF